MQHHPNCSRVGVMTCSFLVLAISAAVNESWSISPTIAGVRGDVKWSLLVPPPSITSMSASKVWQWPLVRACPCSTLTQCAHCQTLATTSLRWFCRTILSPSVPVNRHMVAKRVKSSVKTERVGGSTRNVWLQRPRAVRYSLGSKWKPKLIECVTDSLRTNV